MSNSRRTFDHGEMLNMHQLHQCNRNAHNKESAHIMETYNLW